MLGQSESIYILWKRCVRMYRNVGINQNFLDYQDAF